MYSTASRYFVRLTLSALFIGVPLTMAVEEAAPELTKAASKAIDKGLAHLLKTQRDDGSWAGSDEGRHSIGYTSLVLTAFMAKAQFPGSGPHGSELAQAMKYLLAATQRRPDGYVGETMYEHGLATLALSEIWGMVGNPEDDDALYEALKKAVDIIIRSQNPGGGWRYQPQSDGGEDTSATATVFHALASARQAGIVVPEETISKAIKYFQFAHSADRGAFVYVPAGRGQGANPSDACTAGGSYCVQLLGLRNSEMVDSAIQYLESRGAGLFAPNKKYWMYTHYYAIQTMVQAGDDHYSAWYPQVRDALVDKQDEDGSFGADYETAMAVIILATPHRYIPIYQR